jgi:hypothetical protein
MHELAEINVLALVKGSEKYIFLFDDQNRVPILRQFGNFAADETLSFTWLDAALLAAKLRQTRGAVR